jgi:hypothetical protein
VGYRSGPRLRLIKKDKVSARIKELGQWVTKTVETTIDLAEIIDRLEN